MRQSALHYEEQLTQVMAQANLIIDDEIPSFIAYLRGAYHEAT